VETEELDFVPLKRWMARAQCDESTNLVLESVVARECKPTELNGVLLFGFGVAESEIVNIAEFLPS
jgi:hypothetical protein